MPSGFIVQGVVSLGRYCKTFCFAKAADFVDRVAMTLLVEVFGKRFCELDAIPYLSFTSIKEGLLQ